MRAYSEDELYAKWVSECVWLSVDPMLMLVTTVLWIRCGFKGFDRIRLELMTSLMGAYTFGKWKKAKGYHTAKKDEVYWK